MPGRGGPVAAAASTTVSPYCTRQLPAACLARYAGLDGKNTMPRSAFQHVLSRFFPSFCFARPMYPKTARTLWAAMPAGAAKPNTGRLATARTASELPRSFHRIRSHGVRRHCRPANRRATRDWPKPTGGILRHGGHWPWPFAGAPGAGLLADVETSNDVQVPLRSDLLQVIQQPTAPTDHHQQASPTGVVLGVRSQMLGELADPRG